MAGSGQGRPVGGCLNTRSTCLPACLPLASCREHVWQRYVDDELYNRDHPEQERPRTQRRPPRRRQGATAAGSGAEGGGAGSGATPLTTASESLSGNRRLRPRDESALDEAYLRMYGRSDLSAEAKRQRAD